jgi:hypothetical protein
MGPLDRLIELATPRSQVLHHSRILEKRGIGGHNGKHLSREPQSCRELRRTFGDALAKQEMFPARRAFRALK